MSGLALAARQFAYERKAFWRNPPAAGFTFAFPLMFLVLFNVIFGGGTTEVFGREVNRSAFYVPAIISFALVSACYTNIAMGVTIARDEGILKRLRGTPLPTWAYLAGRIANAVYVALLLVVISIAFGALFYDAGLPAASLPAFSITLMVSAATYCALGLALSGVIPTADAAPAIVNLTVLPLLFISDVFLPPELGPPWLRTVANLFPIKHSTEALIAAFVDPGARLDATDLAVVVAWGVAGALLALRTFRWEPSMGGRRRTR
jgi:ABC-2 type transport system permease protein